jgi:hypothetical protein
MKKFVLTFALFGLAYFPFANACAGDIYVCGSIDFAEALADFDDNCLCGSTITIIDVCGGGRQETHSINC